MGIGGMGALLFSERGRAALRKILAKFGQAPDRLLEWNDSLPIELDRIQAALDRIAESLDLNLEPGRGFCPTGRRLGGASFR